MKLRCAFLLTLFATVATAAMAQDLTIDDFSTGHYQSPGFKTGVKHESIQTGNMLGGSRDTNMLICDPAKQGNCAAVNPYNQASSYGFLAARGGQPSAMVQTGGYFAAPRIDMGYGYQTAFNENFGAYPKIRVNFSGLSQPLNFNILLFTGAFYAQGGCNLAPYSAPFSVELPLNLFVQTKGFDMGHVNSMDFIFQDGSTIGDVGFGITSIELANSVKGGVVIDCHF
jgi:hypothetical protein